MKKTLQKLLEINIFETLEEDSIFEIYKFYIQYHLKRLKIKNPLAIKKLDKILEIELKKSVRLYKKKERYNQEGLFLSYASYFFSEVINKLSSDFSFQ